MHNTFLNNLTQFKPNQDIHNNFGSSLILIINPISIMGCDWQALSKCRIDAHNNILQSTVY